MGQGQPAAQQSGPACAGCLPRCCALGGQLCPSRTPAPTLLHQRPEPMATHCHPLALAGPLTAPAPPHRLHPPAPALLPAPPAPAPPPTAPAAWPHLVEARVGEVLGQLALGVGLLQLVKHLGAHVQAVALPATAARWRRWRRRRAGGRVGEQLGCGASLWAASQALLLAFRTSASVRRGAALGGVGDRRHVQA